MAAPTPRRPGFSPDLFQDLKVKHRLLSAACRCLEDEKCYRFFDLLDAMSQMPPETKSVYIEDLAASGDYNEEDMAALRRLVMQDGAQAFKKLVDVVRDIRVQQEIDQILA